MNDNIQRMRELIRGVHSNDPEFKKEIAEVIEFYEFYDGVPDNSDSITDMSTYGQLWKLPTDMDYSPSRVIRNHTKRLMRRQASFMFGSPPTIVFKPFDKKHIDEAEDKRAVVEKILHDTDFWSATETAFLDATIGKRVLCVFSAMPNDGKGKWDLAFRYYQMPEFTYKVDPHDYTKLTEVVICYKDTSGLSKKVGEDYWHRYIYSLRPKANNEETAWYTYELITATGAPVYRAISEEAVSDSDIPFIDDNYVEIREEFDTGFTRIPAHVILNEGLTGDVKGESDIKDLMQMASSYNRTTSDYQDALRFNMFEQTVIVDADSDAIEKATIAPGAIIDLKTDFSLSGGEGGGSAARAEKLSAAFSFAEGANSFLKDLKKDMFEIMEQPQPEHVLNVPSAKALGFLFFDLIARCERKWTQSWDGAMKWAVEMITEASQLGTIYPEMNAKELLAIPTNIIVLHNYPLPEEVEAKKETAIAEVDAGVKSRKTYIREFGNVEDEEGEWDEILKEMADMKVSEDMGGIGQEVSNQIELARAKQKQGGEGDAETKDKANEEGIKKESTD